MFSLCEVDENSGCNGKYLNERKTRWKQAMMNTELVENVPDFTVTSKVQVQVILSNRSIRK